MCRTRIHKFTKFEKKFGYGGDSSDESNDSGNEEQEFGDARYGREGTVFECQSNIYKAAYVLDQDPNRLMTQHLSKMFQSKNHDFYQTQLKLFRQRQIKGFEQSPNSISRNIRISLGARNMVDRRNSYLDPSF